MERNVLNITEYTFDLYQSDNYDLSVLIGADRFFFMITDSLSKVVMQQAFIFPRAEDTKQLAKTLQTILAKITFFQRPFKSVKIGITDDRIVLLPDATFDEKLLDYYFQNVGDINFGERICIDHVPRFSIRTIYAVHDSLLELFENTFSNAQVFNYATAFIQGADSIPKNSSDTIVINVLPASFQAAVFKNGQFVLYNSYTYQAPKEFLYFLLMLYQQFGFDTKIAPTYITGSLLKDSAVFAAIAPYIQHLNFISRPTFLKYTERFNNIPEHFYFDLYSLTLCE